MRHPHVSTKLVLLSAVLALAFLAGTGPVQAAHLSCGDTVTGHVVLDGDLACADSDGLTVGADGTTIDLNGFMIVCTAGDYQGSCQGPFPQDDSPEVGIDTAGFSHILVKGPGTIDGFDIGVLVPGGSNVNVRGLTVTGPASPGRGANPRPITQGIMVSRTVCPVPADTIINIHGNDVSNHTEGIELHNANCTNVGHNSVHDNNSDPFECHGIVATDSGNNNVNNNLVTRNGENLPIDGGITIRGALSIGNTVTHNDSSGNFGDGISVRSGAANNQIVNNEARGNGFFDLAGRGSGPGNKWNKNNRCNTQNAEVPAGVCNPGE